MQEEPNLPMPPGAEMTPIGQPDQPHRPDRAGVPDSPGQLSEANSAMSAPSVMGSVVGGAGAQAVAPEVAPAAGAGQGDLRPIWPTSAQGALRARRYARLARLARLAATLSALLFFYLSWAPFANAITSGDLRNGPTGPMYRFDLTATELGAPPLHGLLGDSFFGVWSIITIVGLLLSPLLWQRTLRWAQWLAIALYACWLVAIGGVLANTAQVILMAIPAELRSGAAPYITTLYPYGTRVAIYSVSPTFGLWLIPLAALLGLAAGALALTAFIQRRRASVPVAPSAQGEIVTPGGARLARSLPGAGAITAGLLLWAWGFFTLPWALVNCSQAPLFFASCRGLPVPLALQIGLDIARPFFDPSAALYAITGLLVVGALMILVAVWRRDITRTLCAWATLWLVAALVSATLAIAGAQQVVSNAPAVGLPSGDWRADTGTLVVFLALLLVAIGLIPLWAVAVRASQRREAARQAQLA